MYIIFNSDEDEVDEQDMLLYLPITLEIDDSENPDCSLMTHFGPQCPNETSAKSPKRAKLVDIDLKDAPKDGK